MVVAVIIYLSHIFSKYMAKSMFRAAKSKYIAVIDQIMIGQDRCLLLAKVQERCFLIGVTSQEMSLIAELQPEEAAGLYAEEGKQDAGGFKEMLIDRFKPKTRR